MLLPIALYAPPAPAKEMASLDRVLLSQIGSLLVKVYCGLEALSELI